MNKLASNVYDNGTDELGAETMQNRTQVEWMQERETTAVTALSGSITNNQPEFVVDTLAMLKCSSSLFEHAFNLKNRTSAGECNTCGKTEELPPAVFKGSEHAVKEGQNLAGIAGSLGWL
eukprot:4596011-Amphidinium_carterae.1